MTNNEQKTTKPVVLNRDKIKVVLTLCYKIDAHYKVAKLDPAAGLVHSLAGIACHEDVHKFIARLEDVWLNGKDELELTPIEAEHAVALVMMAALHII